MSKSAIVIGAGIGGLACAIRLSVKGYTVTVIEKNDYVGGKLHRIQSKEYYFDAGPSLFTLPELIDELFELTGKSNTFRYEQVNPVCHYFFPNGQTFKAAADANGFSKSFSKEFSEDEYQLGKFLKQIRKNYEITSLVFLERSLHKLSTYFRLTGLRGIMNLWRLRMFTSMNNHLSNYFKNPNALQYFNRFATYNGSNPFKAPATLCVIQNIEISKGAYFPQGGMHSITKTLYQLALDCGVVFKLNTSVKKDSYKGWLGKRYSNKYG